MIFHHYEFSFYFYLMIVFLIMILCSIWGVDYTWKILTQLLFRLLLQQKFEEFSSICGFLLSLTKNSHVSWYIARWDLYTTTHAEVSCGIFFFILFFFLTYVEYVYIRAYVQNRANISTYKEQERRKKKWERENEVEKLTMPGKRLAQYISYWSRHCLPLHTLSTSL